MNSLNLFILNLDPSDDLGTGLRKVLSHAGDVDIDLLHQSIDPSVPDAFPLTSSGDNRIDSADVVFLASPRTNRSRARAIISHICSRRPNLPIIMVSEETSPDEIIGYLRTGDVNTFRQVLDINVTGAFLSTKYAVPLLRKSKQGVIILFSSGAATGGSSSLAYGTSKAGVNGYFITLANRLASENIRVNVVSPGNIDTGMKR